jgi:hypothetical protein
MEKQAQRVVRQQLDPLVLLVLLEPLEQTELLDPLAEQRRLLIMPMVMPIMMDMGIIDQ